MQNNTLTLNVDAANDGATTANVDLTYDRFDTFSGRSVYHQNGHTPDLRKVLNFYRTEAKQAGNFRGTRKASLKFTTDVNVLGVDGVSTLTSPIITTVSQSLPLGCTAAQAMLERQKVVSIMDLDSIVSCLFELLSI